MTAENRQETPRQARRKASARSRVTNGGDVLPGVDGRTVIARRYYDIATAIVADQGGGASMTEVRIQLIRRFAAAAVLAEALEARLANGEQIDVGEHTLLCSSLVRLSNRIGVNRRAREIVPTLAAYLEDKTHEFARVEGE